MTERQTPRENYDSKIVKQMVDVIHNGEPNPQNNFWHKKENVTYYDNGEYSTITSAQHYPLINLTQKQGSCSAIF